MICKYAEIFCWKNVSSFCSAKATHIFSAKNIRILCIESAKTVNEMTLNKLVKLTMLWTTGPWVLCIISLLLTSPITSFIMSFIFCRIYFLMIRYSDMPYNVLVIILAVPCENVSSVICGQQRPRSACTCRQSDHGLHCLLTKSLDTIACIIGEQMPGWDFAHMFDESESVYFTHGQRQLSLGAAHLNYVLSLLYYENRWHYLP